MRCSAPQRSDGDKWDVVAPGIARRLPFDRPIRCAAVLGILLLENGNHKIAVRVDTDAYCARRARREMREYARRYTAFTGVRGRFVHLQNATRSTR